LHVARIPVDTANLAVGMYVAMLDRPWLETPFVFQGFVIKDRFEIEQLQSYCGQVFVDVDRGQLTEAQIRALAADKPVRATFSPAASLSASQKPGFIGRLAVRLGLGALLAKRRAESGDGYQVTSTVRREAPAARQAYENAVFEYRHIFEKTRHSGVLDVDAARKAIEPLIGSILRNPDAMAWTVFSGKRSDRRYCRPVATAVWSIIFGRHLGFERSRLANIALGGLLLDIGNVVLPQSLLQAEGALTIEEFETVPAHVQAGMDILGRSPGIDPVIFEMVGFHHERYDGSGYPNASSGSDIPPFGRFAGIVDCYDAMTTKSSYSPALAAYDAARELNEMRDRQFHGEVVEQFLHAIGMFPTGSVVELSDGSLGLVLEQNRTNALQPKVIVLRDSDGSMLSSPRLINPGEWPSGDECVPLFISRGHEHGAFGIDPMAYFK